MSIKQKLVIDESKSNQFQIVVRDETGEYNSSNTGGYGGSNGNPLDMIERYVFIVRNTTTGEFYKFDYSDEDGDINSPDLYQIFNKFDVVFSTNTINIDKFSSGIYKIDMNIVYKTEYEGDGFVGMDVITNVPGAQSIYNNYTHIYVDNVLYEINSYEGSTIILDKELESSFSSFKVSLGTQNIIVINDDLKECINIKMSRYFDSCKCDKKVEDLNILSGIQLMSIALENSIRDKDYTQASEYMNMLYKVCSSSKCNCSCNGSSRK